jgi:hypothetical protein
MHPLFRDEPRLRQSGAGTCVISTNAQLDAPTITLAPAISQPTCASALEGMFWYNKGSGSSTGSLQMPEPERGVYLGHSLI